MIHFVDDFYPREFISSIIHFLYDYKSRRFISSMVSSTEFFIRDINHLSSKNAYPKIFSSKISNPISDDHKSRQFFSSTVRNLDNFFPRRSQIATICFLDDFCPREFISSMVYFVDGIIDEVNHRGNKFSGI